MVYNCIHVQYINLAHDELFCVFFFFFFFFFFLAKLIQSNTREIRLVIQLYLSKGICI